MICKNMISTSDFAKGVCIIFNSQPYLILETEPLRMGRGGGMVRTKLKHVSTGNIINHTFKSGEKVDSMDITKKTLQYLYNDENGFYFMDDDYEQFSLDFSTLSDRKKFMREQIKVIGLFADGKLLEIEIPKKISYVVIEAMPAIKGDSVNAATKVVKIETGYEVSVPLFINQGDKIVINTDTGLYVERG